MANVYQLTASHVCAGQLFQNVLHYRLAESGSFTPLVWAKKLIDQWIANVSSDWLACQSSDCSLVSLRAKRVTGGGGATAIAAFAIGDHPGTSSSPSLDTAVAVILEFPVSLNGKNVTGKIFMAGLAQVDVASNEPAGTLNSAAAALGTTILTPLTLAGGGGSATFTIFNRAHNLDTIPTIGDTSALLGTQRRRLHPAP